MKYLSLLLLNAFSLYIVSSWTASVQATTGPRSARAELNNALSVNLVADSTKLIPAGEYAGKDPNFVKGQKMAIGFLLCPKIKHKTDGNVVLLGYRINKKQGKLVPVAGDLTFGDYSEEKGVMPIKGMVSNSDVRGSKIVFALTAVEIINWEGKSWGAPTTVYGTYDTSNGKYSIQIYQYTPDDIK